MEININYIFFFVLFCWEKWHKLKIIDFIKNKWIKIKIMYNKSLNVSFKY